MKKKSMLLAAAIVITFSSFAQQDDLMDGAYRKNHMLTKWHMAYPDVREADAMWSKSIWRVIDLREKINLPLSYPKTDIRDRKSLMDILWSAIREGTLIPYETDEFIVPKSIVAIEKSAGAGIDTIMVPDANPPYNEHPVPIKRELATENVIQYRLKEEWFFDKQRSVMEVRIIGIAPIVYATDDQGNIREGGETKPLFWIYFPDVRKLLAQAEVFNRENNAQRRSFDDIFQKRMFNSYIMKESNVYDRRISEYSQGIKAQQESDRIKAMIINFEHDMWEY